MKEKILVLIGGILLPLATCWASVEIDGICYNLNGNTAEVTGKTPAYTGTVNIPASIVSGGRTYQVTSISNTAFYRCYNLEAVTIPSSVTTIAQGAFLNCNKLKEIVIPDGVTRIEGNTFCYCPLLEKVTLPKSLTYIGGNAFMDCRSLKTISFPSTLTQIRENSFSGCSSLTSLYIPASVTTISNNAFGGGSNGNNLTAITVDNANKVYDSRNGCNAIIETATNTLVAGCSTTAVPSSVTKFGDFCFSGCSRLAAVTIPSGVTRIGNSAFQNCSGLSSINIPASVSECGEGAFARCSGLKEVGLPQKITIIQDRLFEGCSGLTSVSIPSGVTAINPGAFAYCSSLQTIVFPTSLQYVGYNAFMDCAWYNNQPDGMVYVSNVAYLYKGDMPASTSLAIKEGTVSISDWALQRQENLVSVTIPNSVKTIGSAAFSDCPNLLKLTFPEGLEKLEYGICSDCTSLKEIVIPASVTSMSYACFARCSSLADVYCSAATPPKATTTSFLDINSQATLHVPASVVATYQSADVWKDFSNIVAWDGQIAIEAPEAYAVLSTDQTTLSFYYDANKSSRQGTVYTADKFRTSRDDGWGGSRTTITNVVFDASFADYNGVTSTASWFSNCTSLETIEGLANLNTSNVTEMTAMFFWCSSLKSIDLSNFDTRKVWSMYVLFAYCQSLTSIDLSTFNTENVTLMESMFSGCSSLTSLDVSGFSTAKVRDFSSMFSRCTGLQSIDVSNFDTSSARDIESMFWGCSSLTSIDLSNFNTANVTNMGYMFTNCTNLTNVNLSSFDTSKATTFYNLFLGCNSLTILDLSNFNTASVKTMGNMFSGCSSLVTIYIGEGWNTTNVTNSTNMFKDCTSLVGGDGTTFSPGYTDKTKAHAGNGGYLTFKGQQTDDFQVEANDLLALKNIYNAFGGASWTTKKWSFDSNGKSRDDFPGVTFNAQGRVTAIRLNGNNLQGSMFAVSAPQLSELDTLDLQTNALRGDLALMVNSLTKLRYLNVNHNQLTELSAALPATVNDFNADNQDCRSTLKAVPAWVSRVSRPISLPSLFRYNYKERAFTNKPLINVNGLTSTYYYYPLGDGYVLQVNEKTYPFLQDYATTGQLSQGYTGNGSMLPMTLRYVEGDADMNCVADVLDVQLILNYILNPSSVPLINYCASNNYVDKELNVQDIVCTVNIILSSPATARRSSPEVSAASEVPEASAVPAAPAAPEGTVVSRDGQLLLSASRPVAAIDVELEGVSTGEVALLLPSRDYQMIGRDTEWGSRYVIFSPTGKSIAPDTETPLLRLAAEAQPVGILCAGPEAESVAVSISTTPTGIAVTENDRRKTNGSMYDLQGRKIADRKPSNGIYIQDGKKIIAQ